MASLKAPQKHDGYDHCAQANGNYLLTHTTGFGGVRGLHSQ